jgi:hypothetical protein
VGWCWQTGSVNFCVSTRRVGAALSALFMLMSLTACSTSSSNICGDGNSISGFVAGFSQGLDNFSEEKYALLRSDSLNAYEVAVNAVPEDEVSVEATALAKKVLVFIGAMNSVSWDINQALNNSTAVEAAVDLGSVESLRLANAIESIVLSRCGLPSTFAPNSEAEITLPMNSIPSPTATDPPMASVDNLAESTVFGKMIASQFGIVITDVEAQCLGEALAEIYDVSGLSPDVTQYQKQFQIAFDVCGVAFVIPS